MYGRWEGELWFHRRHMWPVPSPSTPSIVAPINSSVFIDPNSFSKDGRKIHVGDCALFKPPHDSPPFVGIIRRLIVGKEENLSLSVNWLYRPADVKLVKGASLEAAPNEVFYSFHQDEIPAASLLHPCKVAFLRKGVELPPRISSFVCRRVYDIENKCLWWLTDRDYINSYLTQERQEEVDQLLDKTRVEMYGGHSPRPLNGPNGITTQVKPSTDNIQNSSQVKSKKREHGVHSSDSVKRERLSKGDDADSAQLRPEHMLKTEIAKITDKKGLVDLEGVEKIIQLMQPGSAEKKVDLACRIMLVDVISVTERFDCLGWFVQLRGLLILDEWLQEVHKGKIGDVSPKETDKSIEEFLFALFRALDRLPVNLHALQTCNVGKSVNHLRSHKNPEIQKKARSLVDTWKSRVKAEMNIIETRSGTRRGGTWPSKSMMSEVSPTGSRRVSVSSDVGAKVSTSQPPALKAQLGKHNSGEASSKSPESPSTTKLPATGSSDIPLVTIKEEKSGSSSPSANNSQSCSSDHGKTVASCREDAPSITSKNSVGISNSRKSSTVLHGSAIPGVQKDGGIGKFNSVNRNFASGKASPRATPERVADGSFADNVNSQRLIVRLPNAGCSPARTASGGSLEDASATFGKTSPLVHSEKQDNHDTKVRGNEDAPVDNNVVVPSTDFVGPDDVKKENGRDGETIEKPTEASKGTGPALKSGKSYEASYSSINALVESCAKFSEANACAPVGDDVGMNLLASVAAGEMSRSDVSSPENKRALPDDTCSKNEMKLKQSNEDGCQSDDNLKATNGGSQPVLPPVNIPADRKTASFICEKTSESNAQLDSCVAGLAQNGDAVLMAPEVKHALLSSVDATNAAKESDEDKNSKPKSESSPSEEDKKAGFANEKAAENTVTRAKVETLVNDESASWSSSEKHKDEKKLVHKQSTISQKERSKDSDLPTTSCDYAGIGSKAEEGEGKKAGSRSEHDEKPDVHTDSSVMLHTSEQTQENVDKSKTLVPGGSAPFDKSPGVLVQEDGSCLKHTDVAKGDSAGEPASEIVAKLDFDLNEVFPSDDGILGDVERSSFPERFSAVHMPSPLASTSSPMVGHRPGSITVAAAAKGPFFPSETLVRGKTELGWKGSAATSAFRPAEPRKAADVPVTDNPTSMQTRALFDFDLNVGVLEDVNQNSGGGLDLDLNATEDGPDVGQLSVRFSRPTVPQMPSRSLLSGRFSNLEPNSSRGFDLNNGPSVEEIGGESMPLSRNGMQFLSTVPSVRMNNIEMGNFSSWFPPSSTYPAIAIPPVLPARGEQSYPMVPARGEQSYPMVPAAASQRMMPLATAGTSYNPEIFRGPVLSSSPMPFQFPGFPFETNFSLPSNTFSAVSTAYVGSSGGPLCFPTIPVGPSGVVSTPYRPYMVGIPGGSSNVGPESRKWGSHVLDLNSGPGSADETFLSSGLRQLPIAGSQAVADEQLKMFQQMAAGGGGLLKRKERDGGLDGDRISYKHPSWQ